MAAARRPLIGVMGAGEGAGTEALRLAEALGAAISRRGWGLLSGGRPCGVMAAVCRGAMAVEGHLVVGVLPDDGAGAAADRDGLAGEAAGRDDTADLDVALFTGLGQARNVINVLSSDVVVVCGDGGPGTASEAAHALKAGRPLVLLASPAVWQAFFTGFDAGVGVCATVDEAIGTIEALLGGGSTIGGSGARSQRPEAAAASGTPGEAPRALAAEMNSPAGALQSRAPGLATASSGEDPSAAAAATTLPVALVQLQAGEDAAANRRHAEDWLERALQPPAGTPRPRLLMLPEIWNAPYAAARFAEFAEPVPEPGNLLLEGPSPSLAMVARLARRHGVSVIAGSIPERSADGRLYNTATVIDPEGRLRAKHRKVHLFDVDVPGGIRFRESDSLTGGDQLTVLPGAGDPLATGLADPPGLGLLICYDIRFPELALLMQQRLGAAVLACPAAFNTTTGPRHWHLVMRARAVDTQCFVLACSSARPTAGEGYPSYGHSLVVDPWGTVLAEADTGEQVLHAQLDLSQVVLARQAIPTGQQRRADLYRLSPV